jgi:hypothetical protein
LALPHVRAGKTPDVLYFCYDCNDFHFAHTVLCTFTHVFALYFSFSCLHYACMCFPLSSELSACLHALVDPLIAN